MQDAYPDFVPIKICSVCEERLPLWEFHRRRHYVRTGVRPACNACTSEAGRRARAEKPPRVDSNKEKVRARTRAAIRRGELTPLPCRVCGDLETFPHHETYDGDDAHLRIEWLCRKHHGFEHGTRPWTKQIELFPAL